MGVNMPGSRSNRNGSAPIPGVTFTLAMLTVFLGLASTARSDDAARGQEIWHDKAECNFCHGWAGDGGAGTAGFHHPGNAPSLRKTQLTRDQIRTTIECGRPGTPMPYFDRFAYADKRCYGGVTAAQLGKLMPQRAGTTLQPDEIDALADYVATKLKGSGPVTKAECLAYFGPGVQRCDGFPDTKSASSH
jgi:mono/diheme cytochrome c family protein